MIDSRRAYWQQFYAARAGTYDVKAGVVLRLVGGSDAFYGACVDLLPPLEKGRYLDLCCGTGTLCDIVALRMGGEVYGVDTSAEMLSEARRKASDQGIRFHQQDAASTSFADNSFDAIFIVAALHEMPFEVRATVLAEAKRLLNADGRLVVGEHHVSDRWARAVLHRLLFRLISSPMERATFSDMCQRGLQNELHDAGFAIVRERVLRFELFRLILARHLSSSC